MAFLCLTVEKKERLLEFAADQIHFSAEDLELLDATCTALIEDAQAIKSFILAPSQHPLSNSTQPRSDSGAALLPIEHYCGGVPHDSDSLTRTGLSGPHPFHDTEAQFHQHEALLRSMLLRMRRGKAMVVSLNEKYGYAFTVVTIGKGGTCPVGSKLGAPAQAAVVTEAAPRGSHVNGALVVDRPVESGRKNQGIYTIYFTLLQVFDAFLQWTSSIVSVLDREGAVPSSGCYSLPERSGDDEQEAGISDGINTSHSGTVGSSTSFPHFASSTWQVPPQKKEDSSDVNASAVSASSTAGHRMRRVRVVRYDLHDVSSIFRGLKNTASLFYHHDHTFYDPRLCCRLLLPAYYQTLERTIHDIDAQIGRLEGIEASLSFESEKNTIIAFQPTLFEFRYLRETLRLYWSFCIAEDDITWLKYYRMEYERCALEAVEVMDQLNHLPCIQMSEGTAGTWVPTPEDRSVLTVGFESFWRILESVLQLRDSLSKDIEKKNRTHRYLIPAPKQSLDCTTAAGTAESRGSVAQRALSIVRSWVLLVNCGVEVTGDVSATRRDGRDFVLSTTSPLYESKAALLHLLQQMVEALKVQAVRLERSYPGTFYRDTKRMWMQRASEVLHYVESIGVVFARPR